MDRFRHKTVEIEESKEGNRITGKIIKVSERGFGFISSRAIPFTRIFFHWTGLNQDTKNFAELNVGDVVEFEPLKLEDKGYRAIHIKVIE
jgi:cold shock CspA family protein